MDINAAMQNQIASVRQAINISTLQTAMSQDGATVNKLIEGMEETTEVVHRAAESHLGNNFDVRV